MRRFMPCKLALCFSLLFATVGCSPQVDYEGMHYVREGWPFTITCRRSLYGNPKWTKDGFEASKDTNYNVSTEIQEGNTIVMKLHVEFSRLEDKGEYKCDTLNSKSHRIEIIPSKDTNQEQWPDIVLLRPHEDLELYCAEVDSTITKVKWYKDGHPILRSDRIRISGPMQRTLVVKNATEGDVGDYLCSDSTLSYPVFKHGDYFIQVTYGARVEQFPPQIRPINGRNFSLECKVHGYPVPRVTWFIDDEPSASFVQNHSRMIILDNAQGLPESVLFIENVTFDDAHVVKCKAENFQGASETSVLLAVIENVISTNEDHPGKGITLSPGSKLVLSCNVTNNANMTVNWYKNLNPINTSIEGLDLKTHNTLTIEKATENDTGSYMCVTSDETANATIAVRSPVKLLPFDNSRNIVEGQNIVLTCNVTQGKPLPTLQWFRDHEALNLSDPRILAEADSRGIEATKITIKEAIFDDRAEYMCVATNEWGSVNGTILVRVKDKYAALWPFLGICAEVAILCTIIFIYERKRQKPDYDESEADHNPENKAVPDQEDKSQDVRQRK